MASTNTSPFFGSRGTRPRELGEGQGRSAREGAGGVRLARAHVHHRGAPLLRELAGRAGNGEAQAAGLGHRARHVERVARRGEGWRVGQVERPSCSTVRPPSTAVASTSIRLKGALHEPPLRRPRSGRCAGRRQTSAATRSPPGSQASLERACTVTEAQAALGEAERSRRRHAPCAKRRRRPPEGWSCPGPRRARPCRRRRSLPPPARSCRRAPPGPATGARRSPRAAPIRRRRRHRRGAGTCARDGRWERCRPSGVARPPASGAPSGDAGPRWPRRDPCREGFRHVVATVGRARSRPRRP